MEIKRDKYLQELIDRKNNGLVKIITGLHHVGKSYLLFTLFKNHLLESGIDENHIIAINLENHISLKYHNPFTLFDHIKSRMTDSGTYYILLDEIQLVKNFEPFLNSLLQCKNTDVYVTGSNAKFLSHDIVTEFRGHGDEIRLYPLTFREFMSAYGDDPYTGWEEYRKYGGMPELFNRKTPAQKKGYLKSLFRETYITDIISRNNFKNSTIPDILINILASSVGTRINPSKIAKVFKSVTGKSISDYTVKKYLTAMEDAFLISGAERYNIRDRAYNGTTMKYYFEDIGLRNVRLNFRQEDEDCLMENIIYNELRVRGYDVDTGIIEKSERNSKGKYARIKHEVDFIANLGSKRYYIQSAYIMAGDEKETQEKYSLRTIRDSFKKIVIVRDYRKLKRDEEGIVTLGILDFLLNENSLDF